MRKALSVITVWLAVLTAGCVLSGKGNKNLPSTPAVANPVPSPPSAPAPPPPLSIPQTQVELPKYQAVDPSAYSLETPPPEQEPAEATPSPRPTAGRGRPAITTNPPATRSDSPQAVPAVPPPAVTQEPAIQEIVPPQEAKRLQEQTQQRRREVQQILEQFTHRQPTSAQRNVITNINAFLTSSMDAEHRGDVRLADALADRAQILAKDLENGK